MRNHIIRSGTPIAFAIVRDLEAGKGENFILWQVQEYIRHCAEQDFGPDHPQARM